VTDPCTPVSNRRLRPLLLAGRFLWAPPSEETVGAPPSAADGEAWSRAGAWLPFWGLLIGVLYAVVFGLFWRVFGEYQGIRWMPTVAVLAVDLGLCGYRPLAGAVRLAGRCVDRYEVSISAQVTLLLVALVKFCLLICLPIGIWQSSPGDGPTWGQALERFGYLLPAQIYRPFILMPLWGRFAMELVMALGRPAPEAAARFKRMAAGVALPTLLGHWVLCAALTVLFCSGSGYYMARAIMMGLGMFVVVYLAGFVMAWRCNGQSEATAGAACLTGEITFLMFYTALSSAIYWY